MSVLAPDSSVDSEFLAARQVWNAVPEGANWNGVIVVDEEKFQELLSDREPAADADGTAPP